MSSATCDRCKARSRENLLLYGYYLCRDCREEFRAWVLQGKRADGAEEAEPTMGEILERVQ